MKTSGQRCVKTLGSEVAIKYFIATSRAAASGASSPSPRAAVPPLARGVQPRLLGIAQGAERREPLEMENGRKPVAFLFRNGSALTMPARHVSRHGESRWVESTQLREDARPFLGRQWPGAK